MVAGVCLMNHSLMGIEEEEPRSESIDVFFSCMIDVAIVECGAMLF